MDAESEQHCQLFNTDASNPDSIIGRSIIAEEHFAIRKGSASLALSNTAGEVRCKNERLIRCVHHCLAMQRSERVSRYQRCRQPIRFGLILSASKIHPTAEPYAIGGNDRFDATSTAEVSMGLPSESSQPNAKSDPTLGALRPWFSNSKRVILGFEVDTTVTSSCNCAKHP